MLMRKLWRIRFSCQPGWHPQLASRVGNDSWQSQLAITVGKQSWQ